MKKSESKTCRRSREGFTLIEVALASTIIVVALLGAVSAVTSTAVLGDSNTESSTAYHAARAALENVQSRPFAELVTLFNADPDDGASRRLIGDGTLGVANGDLAARMAG